MAAATMDDDDDDFSRALECSIHLGMIKQPKALPCQHTFCRDCLLELVERSRIKCPLCRKICQLSSKGVDGIPSNIALQNIVDALCVSCNKRPKMEVCPCCQQHVCTKCLKKHHSELPIKINSKKLRLNNISRLLRKTQFMLCQSKLGLLSDVAAVESEVTTCFKVAYEHLREREVQLKDELNTLVKCETERIDQCQDKINKYQQDIQAALQGTDAVDREILRSLGKISAEILSMAITAPTIRYNLDGLLVHDIFKGIGLIECIPPQAEQVPTMPEKPPGIDYSLVGIPKKVVDLGGKHVAFLPAYLALSPVSGNLVVASIPPSPFRSQVEIFTSVGKFLLKFVPKGYQMRGFSIGFSINIGGLAVTYQGEIVLTDTYNHRLQVFDEAGWFLRKIGSQGSLPGQFINPAGLCCDSSGHLYVCDDGRVQVFDMNGSVVRVITKSNVPNLNWMPGAIAVCPNGDLAVVNRFYYQTGIHVYSETGQHWSTIPCCWNSDANHKYPARVAVDPQGNILVIDNDFHDTHKVFVVEKSGNLVCSFGGKGESPGKFCFPWGIVVTPIGDIIVLDGTKRLQIF